MAVTGFIIGAGPPAPVLLIVCASRSWQKALGFRQAGVQKNAGYKNGRWIDLLWFERAIAPYDPEPAPIIPIRELPGEWVQEVLERFFRI